MQHLILLCCVVAVTFSCTRAMEHKVSLVHRAALRGDVELLTDLIKQHYPVNTINRAGKTPLHLAVRADNLKIVKLLIGAKAQPNISDYIGATPFHYACGRNCLTIIEALLQAGADKYALDNDGNSPLMYAARGGHTDLCLQLHKETCFSSLFNNEHNNPLHVAALGGHAYTCRALIKLGWRTIDANARGQLPLHLAAIKGSIHAANVLIDHGSPIDKEDNYHDTPIMLALKHSHVCLAWQLCERAKDIPLSQASMTFIKDQSLILLAQQSIFQYPLIKQLRARGADVKGKDGNRFTALHHAATKGHYEYTRYLIAIGANMHATDAGQITPFMIAIHSDTRDLMLPFLTVPQRIPPVLMTLLLIHRFRKDSLIGLVDKNVVRMHIIPYLLEDCVKWQLNEARKTLDTRVSQFLYSEPYGNVYQMHTPMDYAILKDKDATIVTLLDPNYVAQLRPEINTCIRILMSSVLKKAGGH